ncbi:hypothetical protein SAMN05444392_102276 [Seinonella peptonophila]|uniref:Uncharacterized protein n=1 Tax=Seinonella peptonophila TaxID=112248 RepID=A0A1M4VBN7_9BACL|nr:hypothetical protein [Seinonella peptonophila]SHE66268.1 hypothetical protein SAMN05444392_102276 [Seinonella peptonophila]
MRIKVDVDVDLGKLDVLKSIIPEIIEQRVQNVGDSLAMTASGAAPHDEGILEKSYDVTVSGSVIASAIVGFKATNRGFDYALMMHEGDYNLGPGSLAKSGGIGMSGANYAVGRKYLHRPLYGEANKYTQYINLALVAAIQASS